MPELEAVSSEQPYRERFRAQLMLALYRSGRQAEGLDVYRRTRQLFHQNLGLEPGPELQELERAILVQNPVLRSPPAHGDAPIRVERPVCPFKGLAPFEEADREFFCGSGAGSARDEKKPAVDMSKIPPICRTFTGATGLEPATSGVTGRSRSLRPGRG